MSAARVHAEGWEARADYWRDVEREAAEAFEPQLDAEVLLSRMVKRGAFAAKLLRAIRTAERGQE